MTIERPPHQVKASLMARRLSNPGSWPRLMRAETAAAYVDERSVEAFRRAVGSLYPQPISVSGKGDRWLREGLDEAIDQLSGLKARIKDASDVL
jgi:hypothetical protein